MSEKNLTYPQHEKNNFLYKIFCAWTFILFCRPQDYLPFLGVLRPNLSLGLLTALLYFFSGAKREKITDNKQYRLFLYLIFVLIVGVPFSYYRSASLMDVFNYSSISLLFFNLFYQLVNTTTQLRNLLFIYCSGIVIYAIHILKSGIIAEGRLAFGTMFDANDTAFFLISFLPFNLLFTSKDNCWHERIIATINIILSLIVILKTGSRGGLIAFISVAFYLLIFKNSTFNLSLAKKAVLVLVAVVSLQFINMNTERYKTLLDMKQDYNVTDQEGRIALWKTGIKLMLSHPVTGIGMNRISEGIGREYEKQGYQTAKWMTIHNSFLQLGAETGIFGLLLYCLMCINIYGITSRIIINSRSQDLLKLAEMTKAGYLGSFISSLFLSQAYSIYWVFYLVLSAVFVKISEIKTNCR